MASPSSLGFAALRRSSSVHSRDNEGSVPTAGALSPPRAHPQTINDSRGLSSSMSAHREPIRSFVSGSGVRDKSGTYIMIYVYLDGAAACVSYISCAPHGEAHFGNG